MKLRRVAAVLSLLAPLFASAEGIEIACEPSPQSAVRTVPAPADRFVHILCTKFGDVLSPVAGWFWTPPGTYSPQFYPAQMVRESPKETGNSVYFKSISVAALEGAQAAEKWSVLADVFPKEAPQQKSLEITAESSMGSAHRIYIFPNGWGYSCGPRCSKDAAFVMVSQKKEPPQW